MYLDIGSVRLAKFGICATGFVCGLPNHRVYLQWRVDGRSPTGNSFLFASTQTLSAMTIFLTSLSLEFEADQPSRAQINLLLRHGFRSSGEVLLMGDVYQQRDGLSCFTTASTLASATYFEVWIFMGWATPPFFLLPRPAATRSAAIRPAAKRSCLSHSRPTSLILHDTLHWPRASSFQLPWEGRGVSDVMLSSFGFISLGTSPFASHRSSGLLCVSSLHSCGDTPCGDTPCGDTPCGDTPCGDTPLSLAFEAVQLAYATSVFLSNQLLINSTSGHGIHNHGQSIQRSSDPAIQRSSDQKRTLHCAHKLIDDLEQLKDPSNGATGVGTRQRAVGNTRVATPGSEHGRCLKQGRRPENRARNMTRKALLLLALSFGPPLRSSVSCVGGSVFLCGLFVPACPSARVAVVFLVYLFHGQRPKDRALRQVPPTAEYLIATSACRSLYWVLQSLSLTLSGLFVSPFLSAVCAFWLEPRFLTRGFFTVAWLWSATPSRRDHV